MFCAKWQFLIKYLVRQRDVDIRYWDLKYCKYNLPAYQSVFKLSCWIIWSLKKIHFEELVNKTRFTRIPILTLGCRSQESNRFGYRAVTELDKLKILHGFFSKSHQNTDRNKAQLPSCSPIPKQYVWLIKLPLSAESAVALKNSEISLKRRLCF